MSEAHAHVDPANKKVALFIAVLALVLAFAETLGKGAQTRALANHIEASNLWAFFQAKTIRQTTVRTDAEEMEAKFGQRAPGGEEAGRSLEEDRRTLSVRARDQRRPQGAHGAREGDGDKARPRDVGLPQLRDRLRCRADRNRARFGRDHHRRRGATLDRLRSGGGRRRVQPDRLLLADRGASLLGNHHSPRTRAPSGISTAPSTPCKPIARLEYAPASGLTLNARDVPRPCAATPIAKPRCHHSRLRTRSST